MGSYDKAISDCERAVALSDFWPWELFLVAAYAQKGDMAKAEMAKARLHKLQPVITIKRLKAMRVSDNPIYIQMAETHIRDGLRKAGIPEE